MRFIKWGFTLLALLTAATWASSYQVEPRQLPPDEYHRIGTTADDGRRFADIPYPCEVEIPPPQGSLIGVMVGAMMPGDAVQGKYDGETRTIRIESDSLRSIASLPAALPDVTRWPLIRTIRHEYGHAFLEDYMASNSQELDDSSARALAYADVRGEERALLPDSIQPVVEEYLGLPDGEYGNPYFTSTFYEYVAESYARFLSGHYVPTETQAFLESFATDPSSGQRSASE